MATREFLKTAEVLALAEKIKAAIQSREEAPKFRFSFGTLLASTLSVADFQLLERIEQEVGEEAANEWLCDVMVASGRYRAFPDGDVQAI